jgi:hypothetical protein
MWSVCEEVKEEAAIKNTRRQSSRPWPLFIKILRVVVLI